MPVHPNYCKKIPKLKCPGWGYRPLIKRILRSPYLFISLCATNIGVLIAIWFTKTHIIVQNDTWWQIAAGKAIAGGNWPLYNVWSWSLPHVQWMVQEPWFDFSEWQLSRFGYYGLSALPLFFALLCALFLFSRLARLRWTQSLLLVCAFFDITVDAWGCRPQVADYAGFAFLLWALDRKRYWLIPPVIVVWSNMHSGVIIAPFIVGLFFLEALFKKDDHRSKLAWTLVLTVLATLANHYGWGVWLYAFKTFFSTNIFGHYIQEWMPPPFNNPLLSMEFVLLVAIPLAMTGLGRARLKPVETALFLVFYFMTIRSFRFMPYMLIAWVVMVADLLPSADSPLPKRGALNIIAAIAATFVIFVSVSGWPAQSLILAARAQGYPVGAVTYTTCPTSSTITTGEAT